MSPPSASSHCYLTVFFQAIECMMSWPLIQRNKVEDSKVNVPVKKCTESENVVLAELATKVGSFLLTVVLGLIAHAAARSMGYA